MKYSCSLSLTSRGVRHAPAALPPRGDPVPILQVFRWAPELVLGTENLALALYDPWTVKPVVWSLHQLSYPGARW